MPTPRKNRSKTYTPQTLLVKADIWAARIWFRYRGERHDVTRLEEARRFAAANGYRAIRIKFTTDSEEE